MSALPEKPAAVAHVSDAHWEAALMAACYTRGLSPKALNVPLHYPSSIIDHARCLILLGEVVAPVDPIDAAIEALYEERNAVASRQNGAWHKSRLDAFEKQCRKHFAGLTFPAGDA